MIRIDDPTPDEARAVGATDGWPYGPNIDPAARRLLVDWARPRGYRLATPTRDCLHWVVGQARRCGALQNQSHDGLVHRDSDRFDHPSFWTGPNGRFLLAQPYGVPDSRDYDQLTRVWPVEVEITGPVFYGDYSVIVRPRPDPGGQR